MASSITAADILQKRTDTLFNGLSHMPNVNGELEARISCPCSNCRSILDPTGEIDAMAANIKAAHKRYLQELTNMLNKERKDLEQLEEDSSMVRSHDEMAAYDTEWEILDTKIGMLEEIIREASALMN